MIVNHRVIVEKPGDDEATQLIFRHLREIATEEDVETLRPHEDICETLEIDALDFHNFLRALSADAGITIADSDAGHLNTIDKLAKYLAARRQ